MIQKQFMSQKIISLLLILLKIYFRTSDTFKNALKLRHCILKTMLVQPHKIKHKFKIDTFFLICYFCNFSVNLNSINWSQQFVDVHITKKKKTWGVSWTVRIKATFQACTWLISRQFQLKLIQTWQGFAPQPDSGH